LQRLRSRGFSHQLKYSIEEITMKSKKRVVPSHHVQPTEVKGSAPTRELVDGASAGVNLGRYVPGAQESRAGKPVVSGDVREPAIDRVAQEADKMKLFQRGGVGNGDNVPRPGMSGRDWNPNDASELDSEAH
jgi:hypothetical protein